MNVTPQHTRDVLAAAMRSLDESAKAIERMDARLLRLTASPCEGERGEITRARKAHEDCRALFYALMAAEATEGATA